MEERKEPRCRNCGRTKKEHYVPPFEYAVMLDEQSKCWRGYEPSLPGQDR